MKLKDALDEAQYVKFNDAWSFAVWHGGHTVNFYSLVEGQPMPTDSISVGDFETGEVTLEDVKERLWN